MGSCSSSEQHKLQLKKVLLSSFDLNGHALSTDSKAINNYSK